jgi:magnesium chelatase family protein
MINLGEVINFFDKRRTFTPLVMDLNEIFSREANKYEVDFSDVCGREGVKKALETAKIHAEAGKIDDNTALMVKRPFRSPHHTISDIALVGGGTFPQPGEISLAHNGFLLLDGLPEFKRTVLEVLRQPLEGRVITICRAKFTVDFPGSLMVVDLNV